MPQWVEQLIQARADDTDIQLTDSAKINGENAEAMEELEILQDNDEQESSLLVSQADANSRNGTGLGRRTIYGSPVPEDDIVKQELQNNGIFLTSVPILSKGELLLSRGISELGTRSRRGSDVKM